MVGANDLENLKAGLKESFDKIKEDFNSVNKKIDQKEKEYNLITKELEELKKLNSELKKKLSKIEINSKKELNYKGLINKTVSKAMQKINSKNNKPKKRFEKRFEKKRKDLIKQKILELADIQELTISEIKDIIVDREGYCSKATFYRYIDRLQNKKKIDCVEINERKIIVKK